MKKYFLTTEHLSLQKWWNGLCNVFDLQLSIFGNGTQRKGEPEALNGCTPCFIQSFGSIKKLVLVRSHEKLSKFKLGPC